MTNKVLREKSYYVVCRSNKARFLKEQEAKGLLSNIGIKTPLSKIFIYKNKLDKACFQHDVAYGKSGDLVKRTQLVKVLSDKAFKIEYDPIYDGYQRGLASMVYKFLIKNLVEVVLLMNQIINW